MRVIYLLLIAILTLPYIANGQVVEFSAPVPAAGICTKIPLMVCQVLGMILDVRSLDILAMGGFVLAH